MMRSEYASADSRQRLQLGGGGGVDIDQRGGGGGGLRECDVLDWRSGEGQQGDDEKKMANEAQRISPVLRMDVWGYER